MERPRGVNCIKTGGGRTLCTLHRGEGLYGSVSYMGYMRDSRLKTLMFAREYFCFYSLYIYREQILYGKFKSIFIDNSRRHDYLI